ncbi:MAG: LacI family DNA-binding transcriptional regulator [Oscillospiraceae bacterium]|nr:LacI family transcriptional regulator [Oscillospiraceae bacterium]MBQ6847177.1 LacI family DNA-binding transcriptional regulator [Oscillospiraceae bacterium]
MQKKRASVKDIASQLHISLSTVHKALTGKPGVSEARRAEVLALAEKLGYVVNSAAQSLARKNINLAIIIPKLWQEYFAELQVGMEDEIAALAEHKVNGFFFFITEDTTSGDLLSWFREISADLILLCSSNYKLSDTILHATKESALPVFCVGGGENTPGSLCDITVDAPLSGRLAADFLSCATKTKLSAAVFTGSLNVAVHKAKTEAFIGRVTECGGNTVKVCETDDSEEKAYNAVCELFRNHPDINGIYVCTSTSRSVCKYLEENKLQNEVSLIGTDVFPELRSYIKSGIMKATIYQNQEKVGRYAVRSAYEYFNIKNSYGGCDKELERNVLISPTLFLRANIE